MGKKNKFPFLFKAADSSAAALTWPWPTCASNPKTLSFRATATATATAHTSSIYKTINSAYLDDKSTAETPDSFFSIHESLERRRGDESFSSAFEIPDETAVIGGLRSDRLFFDPGETSSILEEAKAQEIFPYSGDGVKIMAMDSNDPFLDFRASMAEMVEAHGIKRWECLEELLTCYLRVNEKSNHGYIVGAFVDLLIHVSMQASENDEHCSSSSMTTQYSFTSPLSYSSSSTYSSTSPCSLSLLENDDVISAEKRTGG